MNWSFKVRAKGIEPHPNLELFIHDRNKRTLFGPYSALLDTGADINFSPKGLLGPDEDYLTILDEANFDGVAVNVHGLNYFLVYEHFYITDYDFVVRELFSQDDSIIKCLYKKNQKDGVFDLKKEITSREKENVLSFLDKHEPLSYFENSPTIGHPNKKNMIVGRSILNKFKLTISGPDELTTLNSKR